MVRLGEDRPPENDYGLGEGLPSRGSRYVGIGYGVLYLEQTTRSVLVSIKCETHAFREGLSGEVHVLQTRSFAQKDLKAPLPMKIWGYVAWHSIEAFIKLARSDEPNLFSLSKTLIGREFRASRIRICI